MSTRTHLLENIAHHRLPTISVADHANAPMGSEEICHVLRKLNMPTPSRNVTLVASLPLYASRENAAYLNISRNQAGQNALCRLRLVGSSPTRGSI